MVAACFCQTKQQKQAWKPLKILSKSRESWKSCKGVGKVGELGLQSGLRIGHQWAVVDF